MPRQITVLTKTQTFGLCMLDSLSMQIWPSQTEFSHKLFNLGPYLHKHECQVKSSPQIIARSAQIPTMDESILDLHTRNVLVQILKRC